MINNRDLADDVCSCRQSFFPPAQDFISLRSSWSEIVMVSCQRRAFICLFSRTLKVVYYARGLSGHARACVCECE